MGVALLFTACGQKGPLYLPDHKPAVVAAPAQPAATPAAPAVPKKNTDEDPSEAPAPK
jgi:predicted small lipoprotein YifL